MLLTLLKYKWRMWFIDTVTFFGMHNISFRLFFSYSKTRGSSFKFKCSKLIVCTTFIPSIQICYSNNVFWPTYLCIFLHHITNKHEWYLGHGGGTNGCLHEPLNAEEREKPWLHPVEHAYVRSRSCTVAGQNGILP